MAGINVVLAQRAHIPNTILEKTLLIHEARRTVLSYCLLVDLG